MNAELYLRLCPDCGGLFSLGDWLAWARVLVSSALQTPAPSQRRDFRTTAPSQDLSVCSPRLPPGQGSCWARASLTSHTHLLLLLVICLEAVAWTPSCSLSTHQGPGSRVLQRASGGGAEVKHTHQPCPLDLRGPRQPERRAKGQLGMTKLGFECWPLARTALTEAPCLWLSEGLYLLFL